jgi:hypothetical protein
MWTTVARTKRRRGRKIPTPRRLVLRHRCQHRNLAHSDMAFFYSVSGICLIRSKISLSLKHPEVQNPVVRKRKQHQMLVLKHIYFLRPMLEPDFRNAYLYQLSLFAYPKLKQSLSHS